MTDIYRRLGRLYAALGETIESDLTKFPATVIKTPTSCAIYQDFRGGRTDEQIENLLQSLIANIASLEGYLRQWAKKSGRGVCHVADAFNGSLDLRIIKDLWNAEKHPGVHHQGGYSRKGPKLINVNGVNQLKVGPGKGWAAMTLGAGGVPVKHGTGTSEVLFTGDVVDEHGNNLGELHVIADRGIQVWENLIARLQ
jgi:hypothetical protein